MVRGSRLKCVGAWLAAAMALAVLGSAADGNAQGQAEPPGGSTAPAMADLYPSRNVEISAPPPLVLVAGTQCDTNGNIYLLYTTLSVDAIMEKARSREPLNLPLRKVSIDSKSVVSFPVGPFQDYGWFASHAFYVTPNGVVYNLAQACEHKPPPGVHQTCAWFVTRYNDDGKVDSVARLRPPREEFFSPVKFGAFPDGNVLLVGQMHDETGDALHSTLFAGLFNRSGDFLRELTLAQDVGPAPAATPTPSENPAVGKPPDGQSDSNPQAAQKQAWRRLVTGLSEGRMFGAPDGTVYLLRGGAPQKLDVFSSDGTVLPKPDITPPREGLTAISAGLNAQGQIVVHYGPLLGSNDSNRNLVIAVVDPETGKVTSTYGVPSDAGIPGCVTRKGEFLFTRQSKSGLLEVVGYTPLH
ncbi:MAG: hypothetical protein WAO35_28400 [Terriglobia bacterium]